MWIRQTMWTIRSGLAALGLVLGVASFVPPRDLDAGSNAEAAFAHELQVDPAVLQFPDTLFGTQSSESTVTLENEGSATDTISLLYGGVSFSGPGADDYQITDTNCPHPHWSGGDPTSYLILMPGQSCDADISFTPGGLGDRSATMMIQGSADASGFAVTLEGNGSIGSYVVDQSGAVAHMGDAAYFGDASGVPLNRPIVAVAADRR